MNEKETLTINDSKDFCYQVNIEHRPIHGFSTAYYNGSIIGQVELNKLYKPYSDSDREWEEYEERFSEWRDEILLNLKPICKNYFDNNQ